MGTIVTGGFLLLLGALFSFPPSPFVPTPPNAWPAGILGVGFLFVIATALDIRAARVASPSTSPPEEAPPSPDSEPPEIFPEEIPTSSEPWDEDAIDLSETPRYPRAPIALEVRREIPTSSIPGALAASVWDESTEFVPEVYIPHSSVPSALPFAPAMHGAPESGREPPRTVGSLQREVNRLRSALTDSERFAHPTMNYSRSGGNRAAIPEPPPLRETPASRHRSCTACGSGLAGRGTDPLCDGCGRPLCSGCYWRPGSGPGVHRCLSCAARSDLGAPRVNRSRRPLDALASVPRS